MRHAFHEFDIGSVRFLSHGGDESLLSGRRRDDPTSFLPRFTDAVLRLRTQERLGRHPPLVLSTPPPPPASIAFCAAGSLSHLPCAKSGARCARSFSPRSRSKYRLFFCAPCSNKRGAAEPTPVQSASRPHSEPLLSAVLAPTPGRLGGVRLPRSDAPVRHVYPLVPLVGPPVVVDAQLQCSTEHR